MAEAVMAAFERAVLNGDYEPEAPDTTHQEEAA